MAIVPMKRIGIVGPLDVRDPLLKSLQDIAIVDPEPMVAVEEPPPELTARRMLVQRVLHALQVRRKELKKEAPELSLRVDHRNAIAALERVEELLARRSELDNRLSALHKERDQIAPWGDLEPADLVSLASSGVFVQLFSLPARDAAELDLSGARWHTRLVLGKQVGLVTVALDAPLKLGLDPAPLPNRSLRTIEEEIRELESKLAEDADELGRLSANIPALERYDKHLSDRLRMAEVRTGVGGDEELFALHGWCPAHQVDELQRIVQDKPLALVVRDPLEEEEPPIQLRNPWYVKQFEPLLGAFALPGYREYDPTLFISPFMGLFFGFCLGDLGYGVVLTALGLLALGKFHPKGQIKLAVQWLVILGVWTMLVGGLTGNVFGVMVYDAMDWSPQKLLFRLNDDPELFFWTALGFGVVQLTVGLLIKLVRQIQLGRWQAVIGTIGWLLVLPVVVPLLAPMLWGTDPLIPSWTIAIPVGIILLFGAPNPSLIRRIGGGAWGVYNIIGLIGDVMSYARIFGLGLSSAIIAMVVNTIAMSVTGIPYGIGWVLAVLILLGGHTFNFGMAIIGAVVHPARLQFLEFFGKFFEGGGRFYEPFRKLEGE